MSIVSPPAPLQQEYDEIINSNDLAKDLNEYQLLASCVENIIYVEFCRINFHQVKQLTLSCYYNVFLRKSLTLAAFI